MDRSAEHVRRTVVTRFLREVRDELIKVTWPTRRELVVYSIVVIATVAVLGASVFGLDQLLGRLLLRLFVRS